MSKRKRIVRIIAQPLEGRKSRHSIMNELGMSKSERQSQDLRLACRLKY
jgi:hypothetical protein